MPIIEVKSLKKIYKGDILAVDDLSFEVDSGLCFGLLGPNGAGKSTSLEMLQGILKPTGGTVSLFGKNFTHHERQIRKRIGGALQKTDIYERLTVKETVELFASLYDEPVPIQEVMALMNVDDLSKRQLRSLSGGQKQRVFIATAIVGRPDIVFLDEPTTGLDPASRHDLWLFIDKLKKEGKTIVLTTHYMDEAEFLCDRLVIINNGRKIEEGTPDEIISRVMKDYEIEAKPAKATLNDVFLRLSGRQLM